MIVIYGLITFVVIAVMLLFGVYLLGMVATIFIWRELCFRPKNIVVGFEVLMLLLILSLAIIVILTLGCHVAQAFNL